MPKADTINTIPLVNATGGRRLIDGAALNASAALRTVTILVSGNWGGIRLSVELTHSAATDLQATIGYRLRENGPLVTRQVGDISSGTVTLSDMTLSKSVSDDVDIAIELDCAGVYEYVLVFSGTSGGASDTIVVEGVAYSR